MSLIFTHIVSKRNNKYLEKKEIEKGSGNYYKLSKFKKEIYQVIYRVMISFQLKNHNQRKNITPEYDHFQKELLKLVKQKGILVEVKPINRFSCSEKLTIYKRSLGATMTYNIFGNVDHVYDV